MNKFNYNEDDDLKVVSFAEIGRDGDIVQFDYLVEYKGHKGVITTYFSEGAVGDGMHKNHIAYRMILERCKIDEEEGLIK